METLALRKTKSLLGEEYYEIVQWYPNPLYGKESEYIKQSDGRYKHPELAFYCYKESFKHEFSCYTICYFLYDDNEDDVELKMVGDRLLDEGVDWNKLRELIKEGFDKSRELYKD